MNSPLQELPKAAIFDLVSKKIAAFGSSYS